MHSTKDKINSVRNDAKNDAKKLKKIVMEDRIKQIEVEIKNQN